VNNTRAIAQAISAELEGVSREERNSSDFPILLNPADLPKLDALRLLGLAFSGGGIRSATFNLGVLQGLEKLGLLKYVDYLSTVSGGGYIGSWYLSCLREKKTTEDRRKPAIEHLRKYSQYLAPEAGFLSVDGWTIAMIWLRNTLLLQVMLGCFLAVILLFPRIFQQAFLHWDRHWMMGGAFFLFATSIGFIVAALRRLNSDPAKIDEQRNVQWLYALPALVGAACSASTLWNWPVPDQWNLIKFAGTLNAVATFATAYFSLLPDRQRRWYWWLGAGAIGVVCGAALGGMLWALLHFFNVWHGTQEGHWIAGMIGAPVVLIFLSLTVVLQIGLLGRGIGDAPREWWSRFGALLAIYSVGPLAISLIAIYGPLLFGLLFSDTFAKWIARTLTVGGVVTTLTGLFAANSADTADDKDSPVKGFVAALAPYAFIIGLLVAVSTALQYVLAGSDRLLVGDDHWFALGASVTTDYANVWLAMIAALVVLGGLAWRVDINEASMNPFYRNRLVRCYEGAARRRRRPHLFTGFDAADDYGIAELRPAYQPAGYVGPVPIVNTALNRTGKGDAAMQERRAASYFFTPYTVGSVPTGVIDATKTSRYATGMRLGACVATSGAAASPNMGYHTSGPIAFLLTFFNVRLGLWMRNPQKPEGKFESRWGFFYLLRELFATADVYDGYIYLSDGGHFENLGVYELVRRRCRYIIAGDGEQDGKLVLDGLGGMIRKCRIDFGVEIEIDTQEIRAGHAHCAVGKIFYPDAAGKIQRDTWGSLVYLKSSLTGDESADVLNYKATYNDFPHESTADQFFSESQFESYRALGQHIVEKVFQEMNPKTLNRAALGLWMKQLDEAWKPTRKTPEPYSTSHGS
jgi:hypothetical protein